MRGKEDSLLEDPRAALASCLYCYFCGVFSSSLSPSRGYYKIEIEMAK